MESGEDVRFGPFQLDRRDERLWRGEDAIVLRPKSFAVLRYLLERPGQAVDKEEILQAVWPGIAVSEAVLTVCVSELRRALGDKAQAPQYIETVHRRGYRFIGPTRGLESQRPAERLPDTLPPSRMVGREAELQQLQHWFAQAQRGQRRVVFVSGEPGIGKTTLVDAFLAQIAAPEGLWLARGECVEHYGAGEPYLPVLAALGRLCRAPGGGAARRTLEPAGAHLDGADAGATERDGVGGGAGPGGGGHPGAHAAGTGRGDRGHHGRAAAGAGAGGSALE